MMEIRFFKQFRVWKAFYFWKRWIQQNKAAKHRRFLQENLYFANTTLCDALLDVRDLCYDVCSDVAYAILLACLSIHSLDWVTFGCLADCKVSLRDTLFWMCWEIGHLLDVAQD
jgi:hypothetical protein